MIGVKAVLYTIDGCATCNQAKAHLIQHHVPFIEKNLFTDKGAASELEKIVGEVVTPVFVYGSVVLKGKDILAIENF